MNVQPGDRVFYMHQGRKVYGVVQADLAPVAGFTLVLLPNSGFVVPIANHRLQRPFSFLRYVFSEDFIPEVVLPAIVIIAILILVSIGVNLFVGAS